VYVCVYIYVLSLKPSVTDSVKLSLPVCVDTAGTTEQTLHVPSSCDAATLSQ